MLCYFYYKAHQERKNTKTDGLAGTQRATETYVFESDSRKIADIRTQSQYIFPKNSQFFRVRPKFVDATS